MISNYTGISGSRMAYLAAAELMKNKKLLIVVSSGRTGERLREDLAFFVPNAKIELLPEDRDRFLYDARDRENLIKRIRGMLSLSVDDGSERSKAVIVPASTVLRPIISRDRFLSGLSQIEIGQVMDPDELKLKLVQEGYRAETIAESVGEFSSRGGIIDVFAPAYDNPLRIEFFGDEIDSIREYDKETQRSLENMSSALIPAAAEFLPTEDELQRMLADGKVDEDIKARLRENTDTQLYSDYIELFDVKKEYLWDYCDDGKIVLCDPARVYEEIPDYRDERELYKIFSKNIDVYTPFPERIKGVEKLDNINNVKSRQFPALNGQMNLLAMEIKEFIKLGYDVRVVSSSEERRDRIKEYLELADIVSGVRYHIGSLSSGFIFEDMKLCYIAESDVFTNSKKKPHLKKHKNKESRPQFSDFQSGDYIVHETHGIGRFEGIKPMTADGETKDYLVIRYAGTDVLYIPTEQLDIIQKYIGSGNRAPHLSKLSGGNWKRLRERAKKAVMEIAENLVKMYAERKVLEGYAFSEDSLWQKEFEDDFPYTETDDQLKAIAEIKADMEKNTPMDRLLCGDVGYGKTEVAARAIFKCISEGKQAALLAPTTLLVNQHYHNLKERFENYPFEIEMLSRFRDKSEQEKTVKNLKKGTCDLVIGTHRLFSDDIEFKDLGLLVIDEEQRFGVQHKEKLKLLRKNVDVLTLSATPIPRTLNMSLTGIKDISTIDEPPTDRYPVQTYVAPYDEKLVKAVLERELARGGQAYVVNNRVKGINRLAEKIEEIVPDARVGVGHGQMSETALENTMIDFVEGETDILVATTIVENGIDIPNANTIIILNADKLGLAQLYQLRGRVGRSNRIAYAYLLYQPETVVSELAAKRLTAIREFTEFGSGFKVAMTDLELRGAGNMLGEAQSGHIEGIGYELYCKEIDRAVRMLQGETVTETRAEIVVDIKAPSSIPVSYINDESLRLQAYKKISCILNEEDADDIIDELIDRFGDIPHETNNLIMFAELRAHAEKLGLEHIYVKQNRIFFKPGEKNMLTAYCLVIAKDVFGDELTITSGRSIGMSLFIGKKSALPKALELMRNLRKAYEEEKNS